MFRAEDPIERCTPMLQVFQFQHEGLLSALQRNLLDVLRVWLASQESPGGRIEGLFTI